MNTISAVAGEFTAPRLKVRRSVWEQDLIFCIPTFCSFDEPLTSGVNCRRSGRWGPPGGDSGDREKGSRRYGNETNEALFPQDCKRNKYI